MTELCLPACFQSILSFHFISVYYSFQQLAPTCCGVHLWWWVCLYVFNCECTLNSTDFHCILSLLWLSMSTANDKWLSPFSLLLHFTLTPKLTHSLVAAAHILIVFHRLLFLLIPLSTEWSCSFCSVLHFHGVVVIKTRAREFAFSSTLVGSVICRGKSHLYSRCFG